MAARCATGVTPHDAVVEAATERLRPILMTSFAFVAGLVPLALATGAGAVSNRTIGTATIGGMPLASAISVPPAVNRPKPSASGHCMARSVTPK